MTTTQTKTVNHILTALDFASLSSDLQPDTRRMMREEAFAIRALMNSGANQARIGAALTEAKRVAAMWGVDLVGAEK